MRKSFKVKIRPNKMQLASLRQAAGNARFAYNWGLNLCKNAHRQWILLGRPSKWDGWLSAIDLHKKLVILKNTPEEKGGLPWMYLASKAAPQEALRDLEKAFKNFFRGTSKYPKFKSRNKKNGFRLTGSVIVDHDTIQLPRIGKVKLMPHERGYLPSGRHGTVSVTEKNGSWYVSLLSKELPEAKPNGGSAVGIDLGVSKLATLSDGTYIKNKKVLAANQKKLRKLQKSLARKQKGSSNRNKAKIKLARAHERVQNIRRDYLHKVATYLTKSHSQIALEDLKVSNMTRRGSRKRGLNRVMLDAGLGEFRTFLEYKSAFYGCDLIFVNPAYTSQRCSSCGHTEKGNRLTQSEFVCLRCGFELNADLNAAMNVRDAASLTESKNACREDVRPDLISLEIEGQTSVKQESHFGRFSR